MGRSLQLGADALDNFGFGTHLVKDNLVRQRELALGTHRLPLSSRVHGAQQGVRDRHRSLTDGRRRAGAGAPLGSRTGRAGQIQRAICWNWSAGWSRRATSTGLGGSSLVLARQLEYS